MSTNQPSDENPLTNPLYRYAFAIGASAIMVVIAVLLLDGLVRWIVLGIALINVVVEPKILEMAAYQEVEEE